MTPEQLAAAVGCRVTTAASWLPHIEEAMGRFEIYTQAQQVAFLANIGHESGHLAYVRELWGPTDAQRRYERNFDAAWPPTPEDQRNRLAFSLGNDHIGDGIKYKGRGLIQITGRTNYRHVGEALGLPLEAQPESLELAKYAALSAGWFWQVHGIGAVADAGNFDGVCDLINKGRLTKAVGDTNGWAERLALFDAAKGVL
ncbi:MAG TPA: glycoside hydrolase family 19 protein [Rhodocyclaceae bacterium]